MRRSRCRDFAIFVASVGIATCLESILYGQEEKAKPPIQAPTVLVAKEKHQFKADSSVRSMAFSPDGKLLAVADGGGTVVLWELATGKEKARFAPGVSRVVFTPGSDQLLAVVLVQKPKLGYHQKLWDIGGEREVFALENTGSTAAFLPDGKQFVSRYEGAIQFRETKTGKLVRELKVEQAQLESKGAKIDLRLILSADGRKFTSAGSQNNRVIIWDVETGKELKTIDTEGQTAGMIAFSQSGEWVVGRTKDKTVGFWDTKTGELFRKVEFPIRPTKVVLSPDDKWLAACFSFALNEISIRDTATGHEALALKLPPDRVSDLAFSPAGTMLAAAGGGRVVRIWELSRENAPEPFDLTARETLVQRKTVHAPQFMAFSPDGNAVLIGMDSDITASRPDARKRTVLAWATKDGAEKWLTSEESKEKASYALSPDGKILIASGRGWMKVLNADNGKTMQVVKGEGRFAQAHCKIVFGPDPDEFAKIGPGAIEFWRRGSGETVALVRTIVDALKLGVLDIGALSPDLKRVARKSSNFLSVMDVDTKKIVCQMRGHKTNVGQVFFSPCGKWIVSTGDFQDHNLYIWDANTGVEMKRLEVPNRVTEVVFSPDGKWLATGGDVLELPTGKKLLTLETKSRVLAMAFNRQGDKVAAITTSAFHVWTLHKERPAEKKDAPPKQNSANKPPVPAQLPSLTAREILANRNLDGLTGFVGFNSANNVVGDREIGRDQKLMAVDVNDGKEKWSLRRKAFSGSSFFGLSPDGKILAGRTEKGIVVWNAENGKELFADSTVGSPTRFAFGAKPGEFASLSTYVSTQFWKFDPVKETVVRGETLRDDGGGKMFDLSPDFKSCVTGLRDELRVWDLATTRRICSLQGHTKPAFGARFSPCGKWIISAAYDNTTKIWDSKTGEECATLAYDKHTHALAISRDSKWLATGSISSNSGEVVIWELPTGRKLLTLEVATPSKFKSVTAVAFNQRADLLAAVSDGALYVWALKESPPAKTK